jgi:hypothetical protein
VHHHHDYKEQKAGQMRLMRLSHIMSKTFQNSVVAKSQKKKPIRTDWYVSGFFRSDEATTNFRRFYLGINRKISLYVTAKINEISNRKPAA